MSNLTFSRFLAIMEDGGQDIQRIMGEISALDVQIAQRTAPLIARKVQLNKRLMQLQKQASSQGNNAQQQQTTLSNTTTPGSAGAATPGGGAPSM